MQRISTFTDNICTVDSPIKIDHEIINQLLQAGRVSKKGKAVKLFQIQTKIVSR